MNNVNISKVYLLDVPLENDYKNTLYFSDKTTQQNYFAGKVKKTLERFSYLRKDNVITIRPATKGKSYPFKYISLNCSSIFSFLNKYLKSSRGCCIML